MHYGGRYFKTFYFQKYFAGVPCAWSVTSQRTQNQGNWLRNEGDMAPQCWEQKSKKKQRETAITNYYANGNNW
jgi:hypothetical protein